MIPVDAHGHYAFPFDHGSLADLALYQQTVVVIQQDCSEEAIAHSAHDRGAVPVAHDNETIAGVAQDREIVVLAGYRKNCEAD